ncbi:MAG: sigma-70 family RNA polymerase sigma factor [Planctomycetota bacterium]
MNEGPNLDACERLAQHQAIVWRIVRSFCSRSADQEDLFQEICVAIWTARDKIPVDVKPTTYVYRVALNRAISWRRKRNSYRRNLSLYQQQEQHVSVGPVSESHDDALERMHHAIKCLEPTDRCVVLMMLDGLEYAAMAEVLGVTQAAVRKRMSRAKQRLMKRFHEQTRSE